MAFLLLWIKDGIVACSLRPIKLPEKGTVMLGIFRHYTTPEMLVRQPGEGFIGFCRWHHKTPYLIPNPPSGYPKAITIRSDRPPPLRVALQDQPLCAVFGVRNSDQRLRIRKIVNEF